MVDFPIPANDDATKSINLIISIVTDAIAEGLAVRKMDKDKKAAEEEAERETKAAAIKSKTIQDIEDREDAEIEKGAAKRPSTDKGTKLKDDGSASADKRPAKRPRKPVAKKGN